MSRTRPHTRLVAVALALSLALAAATPAHPRPRARRQLAEDDSLQPEQEAQGEVAGRPKRKLEGIAQAGFGIKNAILGLAFGSGTTWKRQARATSDLQSRPTSAQRQADTPGQLPTSAQRSARATQEGLLVAPLSPLLPATPITSRPAAPARPQRQAPPKSTADDIPEFDRNKVTLDFPGTLFGPSVSLLIKTTKIVGDVIQNSAVRYQTFLRLFRPLFRGPFEIKGLDPATTTTSTAAPAPADNEVRRRRRA